MPPDMASLKGLGGFEVTSTEIVLDGARRRSRECTALKFFCDTDKWIKFTATNFTYFPTMCI